MAMAFCDKPFFSRSISARSLLLDTKAISMPEKKAEKSMVTSKHIISEVIVSVI
jgi:hypothetical protein